MATTTVGLTQSRFAAPEYLIAIGGSYFIFALAVAAVFVPEIRWLHVAQAALYGVAIFLSVRKRVWGYFIGASAAVFWNVLALFGSPLFAEILAQPVRPDLILQGLAWFANVAIIVGSMLGYKWHAAKARRDIGVFALAFVLSNGYLVLATALLAPSYLSHLAGILHPHWPWLPS